MVLSESWRLGGSLAWGGGVCLPVRHKIASKKYWFFNCTKFYSKSCSLVVQNTRHTCYITVEQKDSWWWWWCPPLPRPVLSIPKLPSAASFSSSFSFLLFCFVCLFDTSVSLSTLAAAPVDAGAGVLILGGVCVSESFNHMPKTII